MSYNRYKNTQKRKNYLLIHNKEKGLSHESIFVRIAPFSLTSITVI